ncbi:MAG: GNVR domain-containing protein [Candidatus Krumholzibacteriales bacterium]
MDNVRKITPEQNPERIDLKEYWKILWRKKYMLIIPAVISMAISIFGVRQLTPVYQSSTVISAERDRAFSGSVDRYISDNGGNSRNRRYLSMVRAEINSTSFLESVIEKLGLMEAAAARGYLRDRQSGEEVVSPEDRLRRELVGLLSDKLEVSSPAPGFYRIGVLDTDPENAHILAEEITEAYLDAQQTQKIAGIRKAGAFSNEQLAIYREKLDASEKELARLEAELNRSDQEGNPVNGRNVNAAKVRLNNLKAEVGKNRITLNRIRNRLTSIFEMIPSSRRIAENERVQSIENQLSATGDERMLAVMGSESGLEDIDQRIESLWDQLRARIGAIVREEYSEVSGEYHPIITEYFFQQYKLQYYQTKVNKLEGYIEQYENDLQRRPMLERRIESVRREVENNRAIYQAFLESKTSAQISEAVQSSQLGLNFEIIEKAKKPLSPVKPNKIKIIIVALMFGCATGAGAILLSEYVDDSFKSVEEVERVLQLPVLGTIPRTVDQFQWERRDLGRKMLVWIVSIFIFASVISGAIYFYANSLKSSRLGFRISDTIKGD